MLQPEEPEDFVLAVGETHPVREYVEVVKHLGYDIKSASAGHRHDIDNQRRWTGSRTAEEGYAEKIGRVLGVRVLTSYPGRNVADTLDSASLLCGDPKAALVEGRGRLQFARS